MASNNFINECKNGANGNRLGKIIVNGNEITNSDNLQDFSIDSGCYVDGNIVGSIYIKCLNGSFISLPDNVELVDQQVSAQIGVKYGDSTTEYINLGKYKVEKPTSVKTANIGQIKAYDLLVSKIDSKYVCGIDYTTPKTLSDLYIDVCTNLELTPVTTIFLNNNISIENNPFQNGETNRIVLQTIAKIACSFITIDNDNDKIDLSWLSNSTDPDYVFETNDYSTLEGGEIQYGPVNSVTIKNSQIDDENLTQQDQASITEHGEYSIVINEDYILYNSELREQAMTAIFNRLNGLRYIDSKLTTYYGKPFLSIGSKIRIYTDNINYFDTYVLNHNFSYDGTFKSIISSPALTNQEIQTKQNITLVQKLLNTQIEVNKQKGQIVTTVEKVDEDRQSIDNLQDNITSLSDDIGIINQVLEGINSTIFEQTSEQFTMWFNQTGVNETIQQLNNLVSGQNVTLDEIQNYIRYGAVEMTSPYYPSPYIELGEASADAKIRIVKNHILFLTNDEETAYISNNALYINESTVLTKQIIGKEEVGKWITEIDSDGNLNTYWGGVN